MKQTPDLQKKTHLHYQRRRVSQDIVDLQFIVMDVRSRRVVSSSWYRVLPPLHTHPDLGTTGDTGGKPQRLASTAVVRTVGGF